MFSNVESYYEPIEILEKMKEPVCEMTYKQQAFLCGLIKQYKPNKLLEVGVAEGGTSAVICNCVNLINPEGIIYSVDLSERYYADSSKVTGYLLSEVSQYLPNFNNHRLLLGKYLPEWIDDIGENIDFVILDTVHCLPGEFLDFLCILPHLSENAIVVLHDVTLSTIGKSMQISSFATSLLFSAVSGDKYWDFYDIDDTAQIAAFKINYRTRNNIANVFASMVISWDYFPCDEEINKYKNQYLIHYDKECVDIFDAIYERQKGGRNKVFNHELQSIFNKFEDKRIYLMGAGKYATRFAEKLGVAHLSVEAYIISDTEDICESEKRVMHLSDFLAIADWNRDVLLYTIQNDDAYYELISRGIPIYYIKKYLINL